jgi:hypothetical protein
MDNRPFEMRDVVEALEEAHSTASILNDQSSPLRCRELSLAITKIEEALHWLNDVKQKD